MPNSNAYMNAYMKKRYAERRAFAIEFLGGMCEKCKSTTNLEIDHRDPDLKSFDISKMWSCALVKYKAELLKCQLLCKDCHRDKTIMQSAQAIIIDGLEFESIRQACKLLHIGYDTAVLIGKTV